MKDTPEYLPQYGIQEEFTRHHIIPQPTMASFISHLIEDAQTSLQATHILADLLQTVLQQYKNTWSDAEESDTNITIYKKFSKSREVIQSLLRIYQGKELINKIVFSHCCNQEKKIIVEMFQWLPSNLVAGIEAKKRKYDPGSKLDLEAFDIKEDVLGGEHDHEQIIALDKWMNQYNNIHRRAVSNGEKVDTAELQKSRPLINGTINMLTLKSRSASLTRKTRSKKRKKSSSKRFRKRWNVINSIKWKSPRTRFRKTLCL